MTLIEESYMRPSGLPELTWTLSSHTYNLIVRGQLIASFGFSPLTYLTQSAMQAWFVLKKPGLSLSEIRAARRVFNKYSFPFESIWAQTNTAVEARFVEWLGFMPHTTRGVYVKWL